MKNNQQFKAVLEILLPEFAKTIILKKNISETDAITLLYSSKIYEKLSIESTKLWHLSVPTLFDMLVQEIEKGEIIYPEEA